MAAALTHSRTDEHALVGVREQTPLAAAALLRGPRLVINEHGDPEGKATTVETIARSKR